MKKTHLSIVILLFIILFFLLPKIICNGLDDYCIYNYSTNLSGPVIGLLLPLFLLSLVTIPLKHISLGFYLTIVVVFIVVSSIILSQIGSSCSGLVCFDRSQVALILSFLFSIIYFIILLFQNRKKSL